MSGASSATGRASMWFVRLPGRILAWWFELLGWGWADKQELEDRLQHRTAPPADEGSVKLAQGVLREILDRQMDSFEGLDRKAGLLVTALLALGLLSVDRIGSQPAPAILGGLAVFAALSVLWTGRAYQGPQAVPLAEATSWEVEPLTQSIVDSCAVSATLNADFLATKGSRLNMAFLLASLAVLTLLVSVALGSFEMNNEATHQPGITIAPAAVASSPSPEPSPTPAPADDATNASPPPREAAYEHPFLGESELTRGWGSRDLLQGPEPPKESA